MTTEVSLLPGIDNNFINLKKKEIEFLVQELNMDNLTLPEKVKLARTINTLDLLLSLLESRVKLELSDVAIDDLKHQIKELELNNFNISKIESGYKFESKPEVYGHNEEWVRLTAEIEKYKLEHKTQIESLANQYTTLVNPLIQRRSKIESLMQLAFNTNNTYTDDDHNRYEPAKPEKTKPQIRFLSS